MGRRTIADAALVVGFGAPVYDVLMLEPVTRGREGSRCGGHRHRLREVFSVPKFCMLSKCCNP